MTNSVLDIEDLRVHFHMSRGIVKAVDGVSFSVERGKTLGVVGESGCGKSVSALAAMGLIRPPGRIAGGRILYHVNGQNIDLTQLDPKGKKIRSIRGNEIAMIFQEPMTSLNPVFTIGDQIMESILLHQNVNKVRARKRTIQMLEMVGIPLAAQRVDEYPHQLSGGMRQRVMIAMALSCRPSILIADEPTTALDVTIQAQVLDLMVELQREFHTAIIMITHDLGVIANMADRVVVMYMGMVVEAADVKDIFYNRKHPYTQGLMESVPSIIGPKSKLNPIKGVVPDPFDLPAGCPFEARCSESTDKCHWAAPELKEISSGHLVACWRHQ